MSPAVTSNENIEYSNDGMQTFEFQTLHSDIVKGVASPEANVLESQECFKPGAPKFAAKCKELDSRSFGYRFVKRLLDVAFSLCVVVVGFVPCLVLCGAIALDTKGSPIYTQERIGRCGKPFRIFKFRTMVADSENVEKYLSPEQLEMWNRERKVDNDPRITPLGRVLRGTSVDELPQFINVIRNDLSVIGPRAITCAELREYGDDAALLLSVPQGITGAWQTGARNGATFETGERQRIELEYVRRANICEDARVFLATFGAMFGKRKSGR